MPITKTLPDGTVVNFPDDATPEEIKAFIGSMDAGPGEEPAAATAPPTAEAEDGGDWVDAIPSAAGTLFSLAGGSRATPIGMGLGALGGAAGEGARQIIRSVQGRWDEVPESALDRLKAMGSVGVGQGALEGVSRGVGAAVTPIAKGIYATTLRPAFHTARNVGGGKILQGMSRIINQGFSDRVLPGKLGADRAGQLVKRSMGEADAMAAGTTQTANLQDVLMEAAQDQATRMQRNLRTGGFEPNTTGPPAQLQRILDAHTPPPAAATVPRGRRLPGQTGPPAPVEIDMKTLQEIRRGSEDLADPIFKASRAPGASASAIEAAQAGSQASVAKSVSKAARKKMESVMGPGFRDINRRTQSRYGVKEAAEYAAARPNMLTNLLAGGVGYASSDDPGEAIKKALLFRTLFSPNLGAAASFALPGAARWGTHAADVASDGQLGGALSEQVRRLMSSHEPEQ